MKEKMYLVTTGPNIGLWYATSPQHLFKKIGYKAEYTLNILHPLTSYL